MLAGVDLSKKKVSVNAEKIIGEKISSLLSEGNYMKLLHTRM